MEKQIKETVPQPKMSALFVLGPLTQVCMQLYLLLLIVSWKNSHFSVRKDS